MFVQEEILFDNLKCTICHKIFQDPVMLPCGETVCNTCITDFIEDQSSEKSGQFKCCACDEDHSIPVTKGFPKSKRMSSLIEIKPKNVNRGKFIEKFKADINQCISEINRIKSSLETKEETVKDYFEAKRQQIYQVTESKINELNKKSIELLERIDELESEHLENLKNVQTQKQIEDDLKKAAEFCEIWTEKLKKPETSEEEVEKERNQLDDHLKSVQKNEIEIDD